MKTLMERYEGNFLKVCEHYAEILEDMRLLKPTSVKEFIGWMYLSKDYSESNYKSMFADPKLYWHCFAIYKRINNPLTEQQHIIVATGKVGKGKTTILSQMCALIDPKFNSERVYYLPYQFFRGMQKSIPGQAHMIDEGGNFFKAINTSSGNQRLLSQYFQMMRAKRLFLAICYDDYHDLMRDVRAKVDSIVVKIPNPTQPEPRCYRGYFAIVKEDSVKKLNQELNFKKQDITEGLVYKYKTFAGHNSGEFPTLNDISEKRFKEWKMENVRSFEKELEEKTKDFEVGEEKQSEDFGSDKYVPVSKYAKRVGLNPNTIKKYIKENKIPGKFFANKWLVNLTEIENNEEYIL